MKWKAAIYGRVSTEHEEQQESIIIQREALAEYCIDNNIEIFDYYIDEGYSGTNFDRPGIWNIKRDIESKKINLVIAKDLSRIGRNNSLTLLFLDYLTQNDVRLIAINDNYDTYRDEDDLIGIKTWLNERYSKDLSQKIKFALKHKKRKGEYLTAFPPYGYKKSLSIKNKLEIDIFASSIIREIFTMYIGGCGFIKIAGILNEKGILNPSRYAHYAKKSDSWGWSTIKKIITNPVYLGHSIQMKYCKKTFKSKKISKNAESEWIKVENTHESIIDENIFKLCQDILSRRNGVVKYRAGAAESHLFSTFLFCHECGSPLYYKRDKNNRAGYKCGKYTKYGNKLCTSHYITEEDLKSIVSQEILKIITRNINFDKVANEIFEIYPGLIELKNRLINIEEQLIKNNSKLEYLYKDKLNFVIGEEIFIKINYELKSIITVLKNDKIKIENDIKEIENNNIDINKLKTIIERIFGFKAGIDREILEWLINRIEVYESGDLSIDFKFAV